MSILKAENLAKRYNARQVVKDISISVNSSEIVGLLGPNGAGKTTCFYLIVGLIASEGGRVLLGAHDLTQLALHERAQLGLGYLPQEASIFRKLSVEDNIMAILELRRDLNRDGREQVLNDLINQLQLEKVRQTLGISLSGGERRRAEIARTLATNPKFILLDEPFAGVDPISVLELKKIIHKLSEQGIGVLITDHNVRETLAICSRAYIVSDGYILAEGDANQILANKQVRDVYLGEEFQL